MMRTTLFWFLKRQNNIYKITNTIFSTYTTRNILDRLLTDAVKDLKLPKEKQELAFKILDASPMSTLHHYFDACEHEKQDFPSYIRTHFDKLIGCATGLEVEIQHMLEAEEVSKDAMMVYASLLLAKGVYSIDAWKSLPVTTKQQYFGFFYRIIDKSIMKKSQIYKELNDSIILERASVFVSKGVYTTDAWKALPIATKQQVFGFYYITIDISIMKKSQIYQDLKDSNILERASAFISQQIYTIDAWKTLSLATKQQEFRLIYRIIDTSVLKKSQIYQELNISIILKHASVFVSKGVYTTDAWKALSLSTKQNDFYFAYQQIDKEIVKTTEFYKQLNHFLGDESNLLLFDASWLMSIQVYHLKNWFDISIEHFKVLRKNFPSICEYWTALYAVNNIAKMRSTPTSLSEQFSILEKEQGVLLDSTNKDLQVIQEYVDTNEKQFRIGSHVHWGVIGVYGLSKVDVTRLSHSFANVYRQQNQDRVVFDVYANQSSGLTLTSIGNIERYVNYLLAVAVFSSHFDFSNPLQLETYLPLLYSSSIIKGARILHNLKDERIDILIRLDDAQVLLSEPRNQKSTI